MLPSQPPCENEIEIDCVVLYFIRSGSIADGAHSMFNYATPAAEKKIQKT